MNRLIMTDPMIPLKEVYTARRRIAPIVSHTPLIESAWLSRHIGSDIRLKLENLQNTGSFKLRGATNKLLSLSEDERKRGVITVSSGNHGRAVSYVAGKLGLRAMICLSAAVPENKRRAIAELGGEVVIAGETYDEAALRVDELRAQHGLTFVQPFDDPDIIAGQGTIGLELMDDFSQIDTVVVPLSGGGLLSGIALTLKQINPDIHVVGVTMERGPAMIESLKAGHIVEVVEEPTLADALAGGLGSENHYTFPLVQRYMDEGVLVSEAEIAEAMTFMLEEHHMAVEGGGAVGIAAVMHRKIERLGDHIAIVISGGNVSLDTILQVAGVEYPYQNKS